MDKVAFSVTRVYNNGPNYKLGGGVGLLSKNHLIVPLKSKNDSLYIDIFDITHCHAKVGATNEFEGYCTQVADCEVPVTDKNGKPTGAFETKTLTKDYRIWYKKLS